MVRRQWSRSCRRPKVDAVVVLVALACLQLIGMGHLHIHAGLVREVVHDHFHIGHHEHGDPHDQGGDSHADPEGRNDGDQEPRRGTTVVSFAQDTQLRPASVAVQVDPNTDDRPSIESDNDFHAARFLPPHGPRAPPV
jgi:hypothetical protein